MVGRPSSPMAAGINSCLCACLKTCDMIDRIFTTDVHSNGFLLSPCGFEVIASNQASTARGRISVQSRSPQRGRIQLSRRSSLIVMVSPARTPMPDDFFSSESLKCSAAARNVRVPFVPCSMLMSRPSRPTPRVRFGFADGFHQPYNLGVLHLLTVRRTRSLKPIDPGHSFRPSTGQ